MAHLTSRHKLTVALSNAVPTSDSVNTQTFAIQGPTDITFTFDNIQLGNIGIYNVAFDYGDDTSEIIIQPSFSLGLPTNLSLSALEHTYYQTTSSASTLTATAIIRYLSVNGNKPLSATHNIIIKQTAANMIDKNLTVLNSQLYTVAGSATPIFNIESDDNIVYPSTFIEVDEPVVFDDGIYLDTNPETGIDTNDEFLYSSTITIGSDLTNYGLSALSGSGFTLQGKSGKQYTVAFGTEENYLRHVYPQSSNSILLSSYFISPPTILELQEKIVSLFEAENLIGVGNEFSSINISSDNLIFLHTNQLPPEATLYTFTTTTSSTSSHYTYVGPVGFNYQPFTAPTDLIYSYLANSYGPTGLTGLSAVNRLKTDKDALFIRAL